MLQKNRKERININYTIMAQNKKFNGNGGKRNDISQKRAPETYSESHNRCVYDNGIYIPERIKISSDIRQGAVTIKLGKEYAGRGFVIYSGRKSTKVKITEGVLDAKGNFTFKAEYGKNYTLVIK